MSEYITDEAVEKAARVEWSTDYPITPWEGAPEDIRDYYRDGARVALEAAAPLIAAQALRDAAEAFATALSGRRDVQGILRARADQIEAGR